MGACMHVPGVLCDNCRGYTIPAVPMPAWVNLPYYPPPQSGDGVTLHLGPAAPVDDKRDRRERIATAAMQGMLASGVAESISWSGLYKDVAREALRFADALIVEIDSEGKP